MLSKFRVTSIAVLMAVTTLVVAAQHTHDNPAKPRPTPSPEKKEVPSPSASPQPSQQPKMEMPDASPSASPPNMHQDMPMKNSSPSGMKNMPGMETAGSMNMGPLLVMSGDEMAIRVGSSDTNVMSMGAMGSGTSWQPSAGPMYMTIDNGSSSEARVISFHASSIRPCPRRNREYQ